MEIKTMGMAFKRKKGTFKITNSSVTLRFD